MTTIYFYSKADSHEYMENPHKHMEGYVKHDLPPVSDSVVHTSRAWRYSKWATYKQVLRWNIKRILDGHAPLVPVMIVTKVKPRLLCSPSHNLSPSGQPTKEYSHFPSKKLVKLCYALCKVLPEKWLKKF